MKYELDQYYLSKYHSDDDSGNVRVWTFIVWEESCIPDWIDYLRSQHIPAAISPLHDRDHHKDDLGDHQKNHWHVILNFSGKKSYEQVKKITDHINAGFPVRVAEIGGMTRYLIHLDDPDKAQYRREDCITLSGYDIEFYFEIPKSKVKQYVMEICLFIEENHISSFYELERFCLYNNPDWFFVVMQCATNAFVNLLKSRKNYYTEHIVNPKKESE